MQNLLKGFHFLEDLNDFWAGNFGNEANRKELVSVANMAKVNFALIK